MTYSPSSRAICGPAISVRTDFDVARPPVHTGWEAERTFGANVTLPVVSERSEIVIATKEDKGECITSST